MEKGGEREWIGIEKEIDGEGKGRSSFLSGVVADVRRRKEIDEEGKGRRSLLGGAVAEVQRRGALAQHVQQARRQRRS